MSRSEDLASGISLAPVRNSRLTRPRPELDRQVVVTRDRGAAADPNGIPSGGKARKSQAKAATSEPTTKARVTTTTRLQQVVIPQHLPIDGREAPAGHRICPSPTPGVARHGHVLVRQTIAIADCNQRQCGSYHKCSGCMFSDKPQWAGAELPPLENGPSAHARDRRHSVTQPKPKKGK